MKKICKRMACFLLAAVLLSGCLMEISIPVSADYENTYVNTGNLRQDIIGVAKTQVGYKEYGSNYTKYGEWWGHNPMAWCAVFISWCAEQAGVPETVMKQSSFANPGSFGLTDIFTGSQRTPQPGDLMFKSNGGHVALVYRVEGSICYTIEGNTYTYADPKDGVMYRERDLYSSSYYFASPNYGSSSGAVTSPNPGGNTATTPPACNHSYVKGADTEHPHKEYYKCSKCGNQYYTGTEKTVSDCKICKQENCSHSYEQWKKEDDTYHSAVCTLCELEKREAHAWGSDEVLLEPTCVDPGTKKQICEDCGAERETEIPATEEHTFGTYQLIDSEIHAMICEVCEKREEAPHTLDGWSASATDHWFECPDCRGRVNIGGHIISGSCGTACSICDFVPNTGHMYSAKWTSNAKSHWHRCTNCAATKEEEDHVYSAECDETCNVCGHVRQVVHSYGTDWESDAGGHWRSCQKCGQIREMQSHIPGAAATEKSAQRCTVCKAEIIPIQQHSHRYVYQKDAGSHWGVCSCGEQLTAEAHVWQLNDNRCEICKAEQTDVDTRPVVLGIKLPNILKTQWVWKIILICFGGIILLVILAILFAGLRRLMNASTAARLRREFEEDEFDEDEPELPENVPAAPEAAPDPMEMPAYVPVMPVDIPEMPEEAPAIPDEELTASADAPENAAAVSDEPPLASEELPDLPDELPVENGFTPEETVTL